MSQRFESQRNKPGLIDRLDDLNLLVPELGTSRNSDLRRCFSKDDKIFKEIYATHSNIPKRHSIVVLRKA